MAPTLETVRALLPKLSQSDQLALISDLVQGSIHAGDRTDRFIDALMPVDKALCDAWAVLEWAADPSEIAA